MSMSLLLEGFEYNRGRTLTFLETIAKMPNPQIVLGWRPGEGRAHIAWQIMHLAATDDRHAHVRILGGEPQNPEYVRRFAGGSTVDDMIPTLDEIKAYLTAQRQELTAIFRAVDDAKLDTKPNDQAPWTYREWVKMLSWHEAHHQGQAHLTLNMYKVAHPG